MAYLLLYIIPIFLQKIGSWHLIDIHKGEKFLTEKAIDKISKYFLRFNLSHISIDLHKKISSTFRKPSSGLWATEVLSAQTLLYSLRGAGGGRIKVVDWITFNVILFYIIIPGLKKFLYFLKKKQISEKNGFRELSEIGVSFFLNLNSCYKSWA